MTMFTEDQARAIVAKVVAMSKADDCTATLSGSITGNARFALNNLTTSGIVENTSLEVESAFGKRLGTATVNAFDDAALERTVRRAEELARLAPENPEYLPVGKQTYVVTQTFSPPTAAITPDYRAKVAADSIAACKAANLTAAGYLEDAPTAMARRASSAPPCSTIPAPRARPTATARAGWRATCRTRPASMRPPMCT